MKEKYQYNEIILGILLIIAISDSFVMWNDMLLGKLLTYGFKFLNVFCLIYLLKKKTLHKYIWAFFLIPFAWITIDNTFVSVIQYTVSACLPMLSFMLLPDDKQERLIARYFRFFIYIFYIGLPIYVFINLFSVPHLTYVRDSDDRSYENYLFVLYSLSHVKFRFFSIFDEPGQLGTIAAIVLLYYRDFLHRWEYLLWAIVGFLSFSFFFLVLFFPILYFSNMRNLPKRTRRRRGWMTVFAIVFLYFLVVIIALSVKEDPILRFAVYHRFEWQGNWIVGLVDNRTGGGVKEFVVQSLQMGGMDVWLGHGKESLTKAIEGAGLSFFTILYDKGILICIYLLLIYVVMHRWRIYFWFSLFSIIFVLLLFYQRPLIFALPYFMLIYMGNKNLKKVETC